MKLGRAKVVDQMLSSNLFVLFHSVPLFSQQGCELREYEVVERVLSERLIRGGDLRALKGKWMLHDTLHLYTWYICSLVLS